MLGGSEGSTSDRWTEIHTRIDVHDESTNETCVGCLFQTRRVIIWIRSGDLQKTRFHRGEKGRLKSKVVSNFRPPIIFTLPRTKVMNESHNNGNKLESIHPRLDQVLHGFLIRFQVIFILVLLRACVIVSTTHTGNSNARGQGATNVYEEVSQVAAGNL